MEQSLNKEDKIYFIGEKQAMTVKAVNDRFLIATKPYNPKRTVIYTIIDFKQERRNRNSYVFNPYDYKEQKDIDDCMKDLLSGECEISHRNWVFISINWEKTNIRNHGS